MELEKHISKLLLANDCVIVPGFGGFMTHHVEATYDRGVSTFYPPTRTLGFSKQLTMNDSLVVQSFVEEYDMSYPEAFSRVEECVEELKQLIETNGQYEMHGLGTFNLSDDGAYEFTPCEAGILTPGFYGLGSIDIFCLNQAPQADTEAKPAPAVAAMLQQPVVQVEAKQPEAEVGEPEDSCEEEVSAWHAGSWAVRLAVACIAFVVLLMIPSPMGDSHSGQLMKSSIDTNLLTRVMPKAEVAKTPVLKPVAEPQSQDVESEAQPEEETIEATPSKEATPYYSIVLASRVTKRNAEAYVKMLHGKGLDQAEVLVKGKSVKVVYGKYASETEARQSRNQLTDNIEFNDSWILEVK